MMKRLLLPTLLLVLTACGPRTTPTVILPTAEVPDNTVPAPTQAPTLAPPATATSAPAATETATAEPATATPSESPTAITTPTEAAPATPDPNEGVGDIAYQDPLDGSSTWFWTFDDDVASFGAVEGQVRGVMTQANSGWRFTISPTSLRQGAQQLKLTTHTVACGDNDEYGVMFRLAETADPVSPFDGYLFKLRCGGAARFDLVQGTETRAIVDWTPSPAIVTGAPADNTLTVWARGGEFRFYVNDQYLFSATDATLATGFYGLYLYDRTAGGETVTFEDLVVRTVVP